MNPRIYVYKICFLDAPFWYWGIHKEKKYDEEYFGSPVTNKCIWEQYTPYKEIIKFYEYSDYGWQQARKFEDELIKSDLNNPLCLNEAFGGHYSLKIKRETGKESMKKIHSIKNEFGKSVNGVNAAKRLNENKNELGQSINAKNAGYASAKHNKENKKTFWDSNLQSELGKRGARVTNQQKWKCLETGFIANPGNLTQYQRARGIDTSKREKVIS
jgi:hypothetical protein